MARCHISAALCQARMFRQNGASGYSSPAARNAEEARMPDWTRSATASSTGGQEVPHSSNAQQEQAARPTADA